MEAIAFNGVTQKEAEERQRNDSVQIEGLSLQPILANSNGLKRMGPVCCPAPRFAGCSSLSKER